MPQASVVITVFAVLIAALSVQAQPALHYDPATVWEGYTPITQAQVDEGACHPAAPPLSLAAAD
jgi:hypothetical protein